MDPEWSDLKIILALSRAGSVAGAARALGVDQSTVSRRLAALEESVGARLIVRGGREFALTTEGRAMCTAAEAVENALGEASRAVRVAKLEVAGTVRVSCPPAFVPHVFAALASVPGLVSEVSGAYGTIDLAKGEADLAIRAFRPTEPDLVTKKLTDTTWRVYAAKTYASTRGVPKTIDDLPKHALVVYAASMHTVPGLKWMDDHRGDATQLARVDNLEIAAEVVSSGGGLGVLPCFIAAKRADLVAVFPEPIWTNSMYSVFHESARDTARVRAAVDAFAAYFTANVDVFVVKTPATIRSRRPSSRGRRALRRGSR